LVLSRKEVQKMATLNHFRATAVLRAENFERARKFYTEVLGLDREEPGFVAAALTPGPLESPKTDAGPAREGRFYAGHGTEISIYERPGVPAPQSTALAFEVPIDELGGIVEQLRSKGVVFQDYDMPEIGLKTVNGIAEVEGSKAAWFKDTEGNIIGLGSSEAGFDGRSRALPLLQ
jgi:catechol 2,3-dioxygenase-like lactoylglutathione lyase family enzyme